MKMMVKFISVILVCVLAAIIFTNCQSSQKISKENNLINESVEDFDMFYDKFHEDSLFQVSRIKFPLGGLSVEGVNKTPWTRENLPLLVTKIYDIDTTKYKATYSKTNKTFTQKVWIENSGFSSEYRFELIDNKWYLVYIFDQNL